MSEIKNESFKRRMTGVVVSDKSNKTIVVHVTRRFKHPIYQKFVHLSKKYHAHDENSEAKNGDKVVIVESRPISKLKKWKLETVVAK